VEEKVGGVVVELVVEKVQVEVRQTMDREKNQHRGLGRRE